MAECPKCKGKFFFDGHIPDSGRCLLRQLKNRTLERDESEAYFTELESFVGRIRAIACGEEQVADNDEELAR